MREVQIRRMVKADIASVCEIQDASVGSSVDEETLGKIISSRYCLKWVAVSASGRMYGFLIAEEDKSRVLIHDLLIHPTARQRGVGGGLMGTLKWQYEDKATDTTRIVAYVRETDLPAQKFLRKENFRAVQIVEDWYTDTNEPAYKFVFWIGDKPEIKVEQI